MGDTIYREDAIEALNECEDIRGYCYKSLHDALMAIPSVEPKRGEWVSLHNGKWKCSECGIEVLIYAKGNFCPNCGADMRGESE